MAFYTPGNEPENLKRRLHSFFAQIDEFYPDGKIVGLHNEHKKLGERLTALYRELGYESGQAMMEAYGYEYIQKVQRLISKEQRREIMQLVLINKLKERIGVDAPYKNVTELRKAFPDLDRDIVNSHLTKQDFINEGILYNIENFKVKQMRSLSTELKEIISKHGKSEFASINDIIKEVPESIGVINELRKLCQNRGGVTSFLKKMELLLLLQRQKKKV